MKYRASKIIAVVGIGLILISMSASVSAALVPCTGLDCNACHFFALAQNISRFIATDVIPPLAVILIAIGGFLYLTSAGSEERRTKAKGVLTWTILGLVLAYASFLILYTFLSVLAGQDLAPTLFGITETKFQISCKPPLPLPPPSDTTITTVSACPTCPMVQGGTAVQISCNRNESSPGVFTCPLSSQVEHSYNATINKLNTVQADVQSCKGPSSQGCYTFYVTDTIDDPSAHAGGCHKPGQADSGTCFDLSINIVDTGCQGFVKASDCLLVAPAVANKYLDKIRGHLEDLKTDSDPQCAGFVASYIDEYHSTTSMTKGGHFHIVLKAC